MGIWAKSNKQRSIENIFYIFIAVCIISVMIATLFPWVTDEYQGSFSGWEECSSTPDWLHWGRGLFVGVDVFSVWSIVIVGALIILILSLGFHFRSILASFLLLPLWASLIAMVSNNIIVYGDGYHRGKYGQGAGWGLYFILCVSILALALCLSNLAVQIIERILERKRSRISLEAIPAHASSSKE